MAPCRWAICAKAAGSLEARYAARRALSSQVARARGEGPPRDSPVEDADIGVIRFIHLPRRRSHTPVYAAKIQHTRSCWGLRCCAPEAGTVPQAEYRRGY